MSGVLVSVRHSTRVFVSLHTSVRNVTAAKPSPATEAEFDTAKPYTQLPGPKPLPIPNFGNFWRFLPFGTYGNLGLYELHNKLFDDFGPIVRLRGTGKYDMVLVSQPEDVEKVFRSEGTWPVRIGIDSLDYYRRHVRTDIFEDFRGVVTTQGEEWQINRTTLNQAMMKPQNIKNYHTPIQRIASEFIGRMRDLRNENQELPKTFHHELNKWALESIAYVALDARLGCLDPNLPANSDANLMITSVMDVFDLMYKLDVLPSLWRIYSTSNYKKMINTLNTIVGIAMKNIKRKLEEIEQRPEGDADGLSILETLLRGKKGKSAAITMAIDMLMAGIDTTSNTTAIAMHHLATNPDAQEKLYQELKIVMPKKNYTLPEDYSNRVPYLKACQKESQRLLPITAGNMRQVAKDIVLQGYQIPKGSNVVLGHMVMCRREENFTEPNKFLPERWLKSSDGQQGSAKSASPFVFLPFGFGPRMCIGRRLAELELRTMLAMVFRNFKVSFEYGELEMETSLLLRPKTPLQFKIEERDN